MKDYELNEDYRNLNSFIFSYTGFYKKGKNTEWRNSKNIGFIVKMHKVIQQDNLSKKKVATFIKSVRLQEIPSTTSQHWRYADLCPM